MRRSLLAFLIGSTSVLAAPSGTASTKGAPRPDLPASAATTAPPASTVRPTTAIKPIKTASPAGQASKPSIKGPPPAVQPRAVAEMPSKPPARHAIRLPDPSDLAALTAFLSQMPKGGDIHHHYSGAVYAETYLDWAGRSGRLIDPQTLKLDIPPVDKKASWITIDSLRRNPVLYRRTLSAWSDLDYGNHSASSLPPDQQFFGTFGYFGPISDGYMLEGIQEIKRRAEYENVGYIETMLKSAGHGDANPAFDRLVDSLRRTQDSAGLRAALTGFQKSVQAGSEFKTMVAKLTSRVDSAHRGIGDDGVIIRYQTYVNRDTLPSKVFTSMMVGFEASHRDSLIVGVNIVGPENGQLAMRDEWLHARMFAFLKQEYPKVNLAMHAGELTLGMVKPEDLSHHINDAVLIAGAKRIGHGVDLPYERSPYSLLAAMRHNGVCLEVNLTSNEFILGVSGKAHPLPLYRDAGIRVVLSTDDPGVSRNSLTSEYVLLASRYGLSYQDLKQIAFNAIDCSFASEGTRARLTADLDRRFEAFESLQAARPDHPRSLAAPGVDPKGAADRKAARTSRPKVVAASAP